MTMTNPLISAPPTIPLAASGLQTTRVIVTSWVVGSASWEACARCYVPPPPFNGLAWPAKGGRVRDISPMSPSDISKSLEGRIPNDRDSTYDSA